MSQQFPVTRCPDFVGACFDFEHNTLGPVYVLELISYLLTGPLGGANVANLPDLYEGAARTLIALGLLNPDGSLGPNGAAYIKSLED